MPPDHDITLLSAILLLRQSIAADAGPGPNAGGYVHERARWADAANRYDDEREHGPRIAALYGDGYNDAARKRVSRALDRLADAGLVELWGAWQNVTHVKLTA